MADIFLQMPQRIINSIGLGESHFREFKTAYEGRPANKKPRSVASICRDIGEALVAFANADGGELLIGVEDDGQITGVPHSDDEIELMLHAYETHVLKNEDFPIQKNYVLDLNGPRILYFSVSKGINTIYQLPDGRCMKRQDKSTVPVAVSTLMFERREQISRGYDREFVDGAYTSDLDIGLVQQVANDLISGMSPEQYLQQIGLAEYSGVGLRLRRAALFLFASDIQKWFPFSKIRILRVSGNRVLTGENYNIISDEYVIGNIFSLINKSWEMLRPFLSQSVQFGIDARFTQSFSYPENACREALINAIAHRDYHTENPILIYVFDDRLEFESPGELLSTISISDLKKGLGVHESRNQYISKVLRENKYMRELGEGIRRIIDLMSAQELAPPEISSSGGSFKIALHHKSVYNQTELMWLSSFDGYDLDSSQKKVVIAGLGGKELSPEIIYSVLRSNDRNLYDRCITPLRLNGILQEIRANREANQIAKKTHVRKQSVARFKVVVPSRIQHIDESASKAYVYNLPDDCDKQLIEKSMLLFGSVKEVSLPDGNREGKKHRGYAFVTFEAPESALKAIAIRNVKIGNAIATIIPFRPLTKINGWRRMSFHEG